MKILDNKRIVMLCLADFAKGIFTGMIANYLIYFFQPTAQSGLSLFITQGTIVLGILTLIGVVKAVGHVVDAFTDPLIANWSDNCKNKRGRRMPFLQWSAIPYALSAFLIFCPPIEGVSVVNDVWVTAFILLYFFFYTAYVIPHGALFPELITDHKRRLAAYSVSSFMFVTGSALVYMTPAIVSGFKSAGMSATRSYQLTFAIFTVIGLALLLLTAFSIKEKEYSVSKAPSIRISKALKAAFSNKEFCKVTAAILFENTSMAFFQTAIMYYVTVLLGLDEKYAPIILGVSIVCSILMYVPIVKISKKTGKKALLLSALIWFIVAYLIIYFIADIGGKSFTAAMVKGIFFAIFVSYPFAALNILPNALTSDVIQYDTLKSGENKEGIFSAARNFITKMGQSIAIMIVPSIIAIGAASGEQVGEQGVKLTAIVSAAFCLVSVIILFFYRDKNIIAQIEAMKAQQNEDQSEAIEPIAPLSEATEPLTPEESGESR